MAKEQKLELKNELAPGEQILWESETGPFKLLEGGAGRQIVQRWVIATVVMLGLTALYVMRAGTVKTSLVVVLLAIWALILLSPVMEWFNVRGQSYFLTDRRAILVRSDRTVFSMLMTDIDDAQIRRLSPNETCLLLGSRAVAEQEKRLRFLAIHPEGASEEGKTAKSMVFYAVRDAEEALRLVSQGSRA